MTEWLKGKKTYFLAGVAFVAALVEFLAAGDFSLERALAFVRTEAVTAGLATLRAGISKLRG